VNVAVLPVAGLPATDASSDAMLSRKMSSAVFAVGLAPRAA
jgi:hypothetical protein